MLAALAVSAVFLASYLYYHIVIKQGQPTRFEDRPSRRGVAGALYLAVLGTHTVLAAVVTPLAVYTAYLACATGGRGTSGSPGGRCRSGCTCR